MMPIQEKRDARQHQGGERCQDQHEDERRDLLLPLRMGSPTTLMSPVAFMSRPLEWLHAITRFQGTTAAAPDFGVQHIITSGKHVGCIGKCNRLIRNETGCWTVAASGLSMTGVTVLVIEGLGLSIR